MRTAAPCSITARRRSSALSTRPAANSTASSVNPSAEPSSYPQIPRTRLFFYAGALARALCVAGYQMCRAKRPVVTSSDLPGSLGDKGDHDAKYQDLERLVPRARCAEISVSNRRDENLRRAWAWDSLRLGLNGLSAG